MRHNDNGNPIMEVGGFLPTEPPKKGEWREVLQDGTVLTRYTYDEWQDTAGNLWHRVWEEVTVPSYRRHIGWQRSDTTPENDNTQTHGESNE